MRSAVSALLLLSAATATVAQTCVADTAAGTTTCTYSTPATDATFTVPALVTSIDLQVAGGSGGADPRPFGGESAQGGLGAIVTLNAVTVIPGSTLKLCGAARREHTLTTDRSFVGQSGANPSGGASSTVLALKTGGGNGGSGSSVSAGGGALRRRPRAH